MAAKDELGRRGEDLAADYLRAAGPGGAVPELAVPARGARSRRHRPVAAGRVRGQDPLRHPVRGPGGGGHRAQGGPDPAGHPRLAGRATRCAGSRSGSTCWRCSPNPGGRSSCSTTRRRSDGPGADLVGRPARRAGAAGRDRGRRRRRAAGVPPGRAAGRGTARVEGPGAGGDRQLRADLAQRADRARRCRRPACARPAAASTSRWPWPSSRPAGRSVSRRWTPPCCSASWRWTGGCARCVACCRACWRRGRPGCAGRWCRTPCWTRPRWSTGSTCSARPAWPRCSAS